MRILTFIVLLPALAMGQANPDPAPANTTKTENAHQVVLATGTKVPVLLQHAISTKSAREGDPVYAQTAFPVVVNDHVLVPAGTYVQGRISHVQRAGHIKGRAEMLLHFTTLIYPNGYTVLMPGSIDGIPGTENTKMKDPEGTVQHESQKGKDAEKVLTAAGKGAGGGALIGSLATRSTGGTLAGAGAGAVLGTALALFARGDDVRLDRGDTVEMVIQRDVPLDSSRIVTSPNPLNIPR
jgi:type IV secretion system protein VirB10